MTDRNRPMSGPGNLVYGGSLGMQPRGAPKTFAGSKAPYRAVVVKSYVMGDPDNGVEATEGASGRIPTTRVECDVILVRSGLKLRRVPVMAAPWGLVDAEPWVPKETTRSLSQNEPLNLEGYLSKRGEQQGRPTYLDDVDGDMVLVDFIEGDFHFPVIRGALPHPRSKRPMVEGDGWDEANGGSERGTPHTGERYIRFAGFEFRVNANGDVLLDTVGATSNDDTEDPADGSGHIRFRVKESRRLTVEMDGTDVLEVWNDGGQVRIDLGEGATQRLILGDDFRSFLNDLISAIETRWTAKYNTHTHTDPVSGVTGVPSALVVLPGEALDTMAEALLSDLSRTKKS